MLPRGSTKQEQIYAKEQRWDSYQCGKDSLAR